jgi:hypothetical protein
MKSTYIASKTQFYQTLIHNNPKMGAAGSVLKMQPNQRIIRRSGWVKEHRFNHEGTKITKKFTKRRAQTRAN